MTDAPLDLDALERIIQHQLDRTRRTPTEPLISIRADELSALIAAARELAVVKAERDKFALCVKQDADQRIYYEGMLDEQDKELAAVKTERDRYKHIAERTQRSRRYSSEQWAQAGREALAGKPQNLKNRIELHGLPAPRHENQDDGSALLILDGDKLSSIDKELTTLRASREALRTALEQLVETRGRPMPGEWVDGGVSYRRAIKAYDAALATIRKALT